MCTHRWSQPFRHSTQQALHNSTSQGQWTVQLCRGCTAVDVRRPGCSCRHSLGAAVATLTAALIATSSALANRISAVYAFGSPRVGDASWQRAYTSLPINAVTFRYVYYNDVFPLLPTPSVGYVHVGQFVWINQDLSSCSNEGSTESTDTCPSNWFLKNGAKLLCFTGLKAFFTSVCGTVALVSGNQVVAVLCAYGNGVLDDQNVCCLAAAGVGSLVASVFDSGAAANFFSTILGWHAPAQYVQAVQQACAQ